MKVFKKMALVALLAATTQSFAGEVLSSSGTLLGPAVRDVGELAPMSTSELASVEGGTYFGPLTPNQIIMSVIGGVAFAVGGSPGLYINVGPVNHSGAKVIDHMFCSTFPKVATAMLTQSQLSAAKKDDDRTVGYADIAIGLTYGIGFQLLATGCHYAASVIEQKMLVEEKLGEINAQKGRRLLAMTDTKSRKMLTDKWEKHDRWVKWALDNAVIQRDGVEKYTALKEEAIRTRSECWFGGPKTVAQCNDYYNKQILSVGIEITRHMSEFEKALEQVGLAQRDHAESVGIFNRELFNDHVKLSYEID